MEFVNRHSAFIITTAACSAIFYYYKPEIMFTPEGIPKNFAMFKSSNESFNDTTMLPWWLASLLLGSLAFNSHWVLFGV